MQLGFSAVSIGLVLSAFAGCVANAEEEPDKVAVAPDAKPAQFDETNGGIEGFVHDESLAPIAGAQVGLGDVPDIPPVLTDLGGRFSFSLVPAGAHPLFASMLGFQSSAKSVEVVPGESTTVDLTLTAIPVKAGYYETSIVQGMFGCGMSWRPAVPAVGLYGVSACGVLSLFLGLYDYDNFLVTIDVAGPVPDWTSAVFESEWQSNQAFGSGMSYSWEANGCSNDNGATFAEPAGRSPLRVRYGETEFAENKTRVLEDSCSEGDCDEEKCKIQIRAFPEPDTLGESSAADVGITIQQRFTHYMSAFYNMDSPLEYSALADG